MLLNSPAVNEYKVLKKDELVGKIQLKQSLDRNHVCAARALSPRSQCPALHGVINALQKPWLVFRPLACPGASLQPNCPVGIAAAEPSQAAQWHQGMQQHADTTALPIKDVFSCTETTIQGSAVRKLEKDTSENF